MVSPEFRFLLSYSVFGVECSVLDVQIGKSGCNREQLGTVSPEIIPLYFLDLMNLATLLHTSKEV